MKRIISIALLLASASAGASVFGGSNLGYSGYPEPACRKPYEPYSSSRMDREIYQDEVDRYIRCIKDYLENANNDIERIREAQEEAITEAKRL